jgi:uncharacterized protein (DUF2141 family)
MNKYLKIFNITILMLLFFSSFSFKIKNTFSLTVEVSDLKNSKGNVQFTL